MAWGRTTQAAVLFAVCASAGVATAAPIVDEVDGTKNIALKNGYSFQHNLNNEGYDKANDTITSATLEIVLRDDNGEETFAISLAGTPQAYSSFNGEKTYKYSLSGALLDGLIKTGTFKVDISASTCDPCSPYAFQFLSSTLTANVSRLTPPLGPTPQAPAGTVPEPGTMSLLGLGLAGLTALGRRRSTATAGRHG